jgi:7,8-dihydro-6-hydroxymethylpterin-pyrophosphokinase
VANGPREIDLDMLFYDDEVVSDDQPDLVVPHRSILEREFVLRPLNECVVVLPRGNTYNLTLKLNLVHSPA